MRSYPPGSIGGKEAEDALSPPTPDWTVTRRPARCSAAGNGGCPSQAAEARRSGLTRLRSPRRSRRRDQRAQARGPRTHPAQSPRRWQCRCGSPTHSPLNSPQGLCPSKRDEAMGPPPAATPGAKLTSPWRLRETQRRRHVQSQTSSRGQFAPCLQCLSSSNNYAARN